MIEYLYIPSLITIIVLLIGYFLQNKKPNSSKTNVKEHEIIEELPIKEPPKNQPEEKKYSLKELKKMAAQAEKNKKKITRLNPTHKSFINAFKGFSNEITDFSIDNDMIAIASKDKTFRLFSLKELDIQMQQQKDRDYQSLRNEIRYNYARSIALCKNKRLVACGLCPENTIEIFEWKKEEKKENKDANKGKTKKSVDLTQQQQQKIIFEGIEKFKTHIHSDDIIGLEFSPEGQFLVSCGSEADTFIKVWSLDGALLQAFNTNQVKHFDFCMSPTKKLCLIGTWQADIKILELKTDKVEKTFKSIQKVMDLGGHKSKIHYISCSLYSDKIVTLSNDETMKIWDINVQYDLQENAHLLKTINLKKNDFLPNDNNDPIQAAVIYTTQYKPSQTILAVGYGSKIQLVNFDTMKEIDCIQDACMENDTIKRIDFIVYHNKLYLLSYGNNDQRVNIFAIDSQI